MSARAVVGRSRWRAIVAIGLGAMVLGACGAASPGSSAGNGGPSAGPSVETTAAASSGAASFGPASTAPASFQLTVAGDANVTGTWGTSFGISCNNPTLDANGVGLDILFFSQSPDAKAVVLITLTRTSIAVSERAGSGAEYTDREFSGTGVTVFDPARGAAFNSDLSIAPNPGGNPGILGTITHVAGSVDCGNQTPGTSTLVASGGSAEGAITGPFTAARVTCNSSSQYGESRNVSAVMGATTPPVFLIVNLSANYNSTIFSTSQAPAKQHSYVFDKAGTLTFTPTGAHVDGDFVEVLAAGSTDTPHRIHLAGDVTCGTFNKS